MTRRRSLAATLVVVLLGAAGCGGAEPTDPAASLEHRLAAMPGMRAASVQVEEVEDGLASTLVVVDADPDATVAQIAAVDFAIARALPLAGSTQIGGEIYLGAGTTALFDDPPTPRGGISSGYRCPRGHLPASQRRRRSGTPPACSPRRGRCRTQQ